MPGANVRRCAAKGTAQEERGIGPSYVTIRIGPNPQQDHQGRLKAPQTIMRSGDGSPHRRGTESPFGQEARAWKTQ